MARREWDEKKKRLPSEISVDVIRRVTEFFSLTSAFGGRRVAIVDAADEMNRNAANALLKILEEPPPGGVLILVSHALGALPPTIRSRCVVAKTRAHDKAEVASFLKDEGAATSDTEAEDLAALADCLPGRAARLGAQGGVGVLKAAQSYCAAARKGDWAGVRNAIETFSKPGAADEYALWRDMVLNETAQAARSASSVAAKLPAATALAETWTRLHDMFEREGAVNLDRRHVMLDAAHILHKAAPNV